MLSELMSPYYGKANLKINRKKLNTASKIALSAFIVIMSLRVIEVLI
jgi:hypothetical protein